MTGFQVPEAIERDLQEFRKVISRGDPWEIYWRLHGLPVTDPTRTKHCPCHTARIATDKELWIHDNHLFYNVLIYRELRVLRQTDFDKVREAAEKRAQHNESKARMLLSHYLSVRTPIWPNFVGLQTAGSV